MTDYSFLFIWNLIDPECSPNAPFSPFATIVTPYIQDVYIYTRYPMRYIRSTICHT